MKSTHGEYADDDGFADYTASAGNPGWLLFVFTFVYCAALSYFVPYIMFIMRRKAVYKKAKQKWLKAKKSFQKRVRRGGKKQIDPATERVEIILDTSPSSQDDNISEMTPSDFHKRKGKTVLVQRRGLRKARRSKRKVHDDTHLSDMATCGRSLITGRRIPIENNVLVQREGLKKASGTKHKVKVTADLSDVERHDRSLLTERIVCSFDNNKGPHSNPMHVAENGVPRQIDLAQIDETFPSSEPNDINNYVADSPPPARKSDSSPDLSSYQPKTDRSSPLLELKKTVDVFDASFNARSLLEIDDDLKQIHEMAFPWIATALVDELANVFIVALISRFIGDDAMVAYVTVEFILSVFDFLSTGVYESCYRHMNIAVSVDDDSHDHLAGQYVQIAMIYSCVMSLPAIVFAILFIDDLLSWYGFGLYIVEKGHTYSVLAACIALLDSLDSAASSLLNITGRGVKFDAILGVYETMSELLLSLLVLVFFNCNLFHIGIVMLVNKVVFATRKIILVHRSDILKPYYNGMFGSIAFKNASATREVIKTAIPFTIAALTYDIEWRVLSVFASHQGPAEAAAWMIMSYIWGLADTGIENYAEAVEPVVTSHLARGDTKHARLLTFKSLVFGTLYGLLVSFLLFCFGGLLIGFMTTDETLRMMLKEMLPFVIVGNLFISVGTVASSLNEAHGKFWVCVWTYFLSSCFISIPAAAVMTYLFQWNGEALVAAVVMGYTTAGMVQTNILIYSDYDKAAAKTRATSTTIDSGSDDESVDRTSVV